MLPPVTWLAVLLVLCATKIDSCKANSSYLRAKCSVADIKANGINVSKLLANEAVGAAAEFSQGMSDNAKKDS
jgi:hypothetical protein